MHTAPDYSAAYVVLKTDADDGLEGHGLTFTLGRGTEFRLFFPNISESPARAA